MRKCGRGETRSVSFLCLERSQTGYTGGMSLTDTDCERLVDKELAYMRAVMAMHDDVTQPDQVIPIARKLCHLFSQDSVWPAMNAIQLPRSMGQLCERARTGHSTLVAQTVATGCLFSLLGSYGRAHTVVEGNHGTCLAAIHQQVPLDAVPGLDANLVGNYLDSAWESRLSQVQAIAQTWRVDPALAHTLYLTGTAMCLVALSDVSEEDIQEVLGLRVGLGARWATRQLFNMAPDLPDFMQCALTLLHERVREQHDLPDGQIMTLSGLRGVGLLDTLELEHPQVAREVVEAWMVGWASIPERTRERNPRAGTGMALLRRQGLRDLQQDSEQKKDGGAPRM